MIGTLGSVRLRRAILFILLAIVTWWLVAVAPLPFVHKWWSTTSPDLADMLHKRQRMADWLVYSGKLTGLTKPQVYAMLGEPPSTDKFPEWDVVYVLGPERGFISIDYEWLALRLGADGKVSDATVISD
jgi:hypothetical protein